MADGEEATAAAWAAGDRALCHGKEVIVRYVGELGGRPGLFVGVEFLRAAAGRHDGEVDGVRYFGPTAPCSALFVRADADSLKPYSAHEEAATRIQGQVRKNLAQNDVSFARTLKAFTTMESRGESERLVGNLNSRGTAAVLESELDLLSGTLASLPDGAATLRPPTGSGSRKAPSVVTLREAPEVPLEDAGVDECTAPRLEFVAGEGGHMSVPRDCLDQVLRHFKRPGAEPLRPSCVLRLLHWGMEMLKAEVPCALQEISSPPAPGRVVVLGDTHGQLEDVLWLFFEHGEPSPTNVYLFNGDVADRGNAATEIMVLILLFKLWDPSCVHMNRGNHEDPVMNETYGFRDECLAKWGAQRGSRGQEIFDTFNALFALLPIFSLVDGRVFVVHGGLWRKDFRLAQLRRLCFRRPIPERPGLGLDVLLFDSVWSDPHGGKGIGSNQRGDAIITFGADVTKRFLKADKLRLVVRSHQVPDSGSGYEWHHGNRCLTVFSASNYCGDCGNLGAALILMQGEVDQILEHWAPPLEELAVLEEEADRAQARLRARARCSSQSRTFRRRSVARMASELIRRVQELIVRRKTDLFEYWAEADTSPKGFFCISPALWREGCAAVLDESLPWKSLQDTLAVVEPGGYVHYVKFLTRYRVAFDAAYGLSAAGWERAVWSKLMETLLMADLPLREALAALDATSDGLVSGVEFARLIESCHVRITPLQARALLRTLASRSETAQALPSAQEVLQGSLSLTTTLPNPLHMTANRVSVWEMLERLTVSLPVASHSAADPEAAAWAVSKLRPLAAAVVDDAWRRLVPADAAKADWPLPKVLAAWFEDVDSSGNGFLDEDEFVTALSALAPALERGGCPSDPDSLRRLARYCDIVGNGRINYFELLNGLTWEESLGDDFRQDILETMHASIFFNIAPMRSALKRFDLELAGLVAREDFEKALRAVHTTLAASGAEGGGLDRDQIDAIARHLPLVDGLIDYEAFLKSFRIVDTLLLPTPR